MTKWSSIKPGLTFSNPGCHWTKLQSCGCAPVDWSATKCQNEIKWSGPKRGSFCKVVTSSSLITQQLPSSCVSQPEKSTPPCIKENKNKIFQKSFRFVILSFLCFIILSFGVLVFWWFGGLVVWWSNDLPVWQYGLWSFQTGGTKLERFLPKNQFTQRKLLNFEDWVNVEVLVLKKIKQT